MGAAIIEVDNLTKSYGDVQALRGVSFFVQEGEVFGLLGPNGAGKTSTVEILEGLRPPGGGRVSVCGLDPQTSGAAFKQAIGMLRRGGTCVLNGLPPGEFPVSIFDVVLNGYTIRGSIVGTRLDLEEALSFAAEGKVKAIIETQPLESINDVLQRLKTGKVNGRVVLTIGVQASQEAFRKSG